MIYGDHGGDCCGMVHLYNFSSYRGIDSDANRTLYLQQETMLALDYLSDGEDDNRGRVVEVVLTDDQLQQWANAVKEVGYVPVSRFLNSNTGNVCTVFHYHESGLLPLTDVPGFKPEAPAVTVKHSRFKNVYGGRMGQRDFMTLMAANEARTAKHRTGVVRRDYMSDGTFQDTELDNS